jgi:signal transduction histidine kinase
MKVTEQQDQWQARREREWWCAPLVSYPGAVAFTAAAFLIPVSEKYLGIQDFFVEPPFVVANLLIGWIWGIGPALLALLLGVLALDYWIVPPIGAISFFLWPDIASFAPFILIQLIVLWLIVAQKKYRQQLLHANQAIAQHADELAASNARLEEADRVKDQFLSMASHELRTPVTSIQGYVQLLQHRLQKQGMQHPELLPVYESLDQVKAQTRRLTDLVTDLLDINTLRLGKMPMHLASCDLCELCRKVVEDQSALTGRLIEVHISSCPLILQADEVRLAQVAVNLLNNALKYSPAGTAVRMDISQRAREALLAVHNESPLISPEQQQALFEPFYCGSTSRSKASGWGLGLAICKEIVARHDGRIWVESSEGKGRLSW